MAIPNKYIDKIKDKESGESRPICPPAEHVSVDNENFEGETLDEVLGEVARSIEEAGQGGYAPPAGGIPKTDLAKSVQDSLDKADSALQDEDLADYATKTELATKQDALVAGNGIVIAQDGKTVSVDAEVVEPATADGSFTIRIGNNTYTINLNHSHPQYLQAQSLKAGSNVSISVNQQTGEVTISSTGGSGGGGISGITMNGNAVPVGSNGVVDLGTVITSLAGYVLSSALAAVATSGSYNDLSNKPDLSGLVNIGKIINANDNTTKRLWIGTQTEFDEMEEYDADVLYLIAAAATVPVYSIDLDLFDASVPQNTPTSVERGSQFSVTVTPDTNMTLAKSSGAMNGGGTLTKTVNQDGSVTYSTNSVTGKITISASATTAKIATAGGKLSIMTAKTFMRVGTNNHPNQTYNANSYYAPQGSNKWDFRPGLVFDGFLRAYDYYNGSSEDVNDLMTWVRNYYRAHVDSNGAIVDTGTAYVASNGNAFHVSPGYHLFHMLELDPNNSSNNYDALATILHDQLVNYQGKLTAGTTAHPYIRSNTLQHQTTLEVAHHIEPFRALYAKEKLSGSAQTTEYEDIIAQMNELGELTYDSTTKLYRHGYTETGSGVHWADNQSDNEVGKSYFAFGRALGMYIIAAERVLEIIPSTVTGWQDLKTRLVNLLENLDDKKDATSKVWAVLPTETTSTDNYLEASSSSLYAYGLLYAIRKGWLDESYKPLAKETYEAVVAQFATISGTSLTIEGCIKAAYAGNAGGSATDRAGVLSNYYSDTNPSESGEAFGTAAFILASVEYERMFLNEE